MKSEKCFIIGLSKTGTSSAEAALKVLGYKIDKGLPMEDKPSIEIDWAKLDRIDGGSDTPAAMFYQELSNRYPTAKFILTTRSKQAWLKSCEVHFANEAIDPILRELREYHYQSPTFDRQKFSDAYDRHVDGVRQYFKGTDNLLEVDLIENPRWNELCAFLGEPVPEESFPHKNRTTLMEKLRRKLIKIRG